MTMKNSEITRAKLIGFESRLVDPKFYSSSETFDRWYRSPSDFDLFCWSESTVIDRAEIRMDGYSIFWNEDGIKTVREEFPQNDDSYVAYSEEHVERFQSLPLNMALATIIETIDSEPGYFLPILRDLTGKTAEELVEQPEVSPTTGAETL